MIVIQEKAEIINLKISLIGKKLTINFKKVISTTHLTPIIFKVITIAVNNFDLTS